MAKTCPSCGYHPIGPFSDNCPICAEPVRNVCGGGGGRSANPSPLTRWAIGALLVAGLIVAGRWGLGGGRRAPVVTEPDRAVERALAARRAQAVGLSAARLLREAQSDPGADQKYKGKYLELNGVVERSGKDRDDTHFVILHGGDERVALKIECFFDAADEEDEARIAQLRAGQTISLCGQYSGRVSHIQIRDCILIK